MQFGVCLPHRWKYASARLIADVAQEAESLRFDSVWVTDHVIVPVHHVERGHIFYDALMTLAFVSSITRTVAMGTTVLAAPTRNPIVLAREVATLDALSGGRVILGVGTGWIREELEAVGVPWTERGRFLDEGIKVLRCLWSQEGPISFSGRYTNFREMLFEPKPARRGGPPIWVGGMTAPSLQRVARTADGWLPWAVSKDDLKEGAEKIRSMSGGRKITLACFSQADIGSKSIEAYVGTLGERHHVITGSPGQVVRTIEDFRKSGLEHLALSFRDVRLFKDETPDLLLKQMRLFASEIMPAFRA
jgi:probable F420-dependent oxidoreductase